MDVSKFQIKGEWLELEVESKNVEGPLKFLIKPLSSDDQLDMADMGRGDQKKFLNTVIDLVLDWDLTRNGEKLSCEGEDKELYLKYLIPMNLKKEKEDKKEKEIIADEDLDKPKPKKIPGTIGLAILGFAQDFGNFIKN